MPGQTFSATANDQSVDGQEAYDTLVDNGFSNVTLYSYQGGDSHTTINVTGGSNNTIVAHILDTVNVTSSSATIEEYEGHDNKFVLGSGTYTEYLSKNDVLTAGNGANTVDYQSGATNETVTLGNGTDSINAGEKSGTFTVKVGNGNDDLEFFGMTSANVTIAAGNGNDTVDGAQSGGTFKVTAGTGTDDFEFWGMPSGNVTISQAANAAPFALNVTGSTLASLTTTIENVADAIAMDAGTHITNLTLTVGVDGFKLPDAYAGAAIGHTTVKYVATTEKIAAPYNIAQPLPYFVSDQLFAPALHWTGTIGTHTTAPTITFSFMQTIPTDASSADKNGWQKLGGNVTAGMTPQQILDAHTAGTLTINSAELAAVTALAAWAKVINVKFVSATDSSSVDIRFGANTQTSGGYTVSPTAPPFTAEEIYMNKTDTTDQHIYAHEIGHALGLGGESGTSDDSDTLPYGEDVGSNTVMSYNGPYETTPQIFDIAAGQYLYGPNPSYNPNSSHVWTFNSAGGAANLISDGGSSANTISAVGKTQAAYIDLRSGHWSYLGSKSGDVLAPNQLFIDYGTIINIAKAGSGVTTIICNDGNDAVTCGTGGGTVVLGPGTDTVTGGSGNDTLLCGPTDLHVGDVINGGTGTNTVVLDGSYASGLTLASNTLLNFQTIKLTAGYSYALTTNDATVASGKTMTIDGSALSASSVLTFNGAAETNGHFVIIGGLGADNLTGGALSDTFTYTSAAQSTSTHYDTVTAFKFGTDIFDTPGAAGTITGINTKVSSGALSTATFDANLASAITSSHLGAHHAVLFTPTSGTLSGDTFLIVDLNGVAGYQTGADLVIRMIGQSGTLAAGGFH